MVQLLQRAILKVGEIDIMFYECCQGVKLNGTPWYEGSCWVMG